MLSVIIPVGPNRNGHQAVASLADAGLMDGDEVIVVGDGHSPLIHLPADLTAQFRITGISPQQGANAARNHGIQLAKNAIMCFLDDDDAYLPEALNTIRAQANAHPSQLAWSIDWTFSGKPSSCLKRPSRLTKENLWKRNIAGGCSCMVVRRKVFETVGYFDEALPAMQDWDFWLRIAKYTTIYRISRPLVCYNNISNNRISTCSETRLRGLQILLDKHGSTWPRHVIAFHRARIGKIRYILRQGRICSIFQIRAPIASCYFIISVLVYPRSVR